MINKITESEIEKFAIELLEKQGYQYIYAPSIAPDSDTPERQSFEDVLLMERLQSAVGRINPAIPAGIREDAIKQIQRLNSPELIANNEAFHRMLTEGIKVTYQRDGHSRGDLVWLIDFKNPENNDFIVANQFTIIENNPSISFRTGVNKRPDVILFINGLPLVVIELKNPADENAAIRSAFKQFQTYKQAIPSLFTYNGLMIISDGLEAKAGSISAGLSRFMAWKTSDGKVEASPLIGQLETLIKGMLDKKTLLDLIRHFIVFEKSKKEDKKTGIVSIQTVKKLASYHQYYAVLPAWILNQWATEKAAWSGTPRAAANPYPWFFIRERSSWQWKTPRFWSLPTETIWTISCLIPSLPQNNCLGRNRCRRKTEAT